jgi:predicted SAM-dependent methyltransferase
MSKINIGCGLDKKKGYINVDIRKDVNPDVICDIQYLEPFKDNSIDEIYASHVLEHFPRQMVWQIVKVWIAKLKPNGDLVLHVPDFIAICKRVVEEPKMFDHWMCSIYGAQDHSWNYHLVGFSTEYLAAMMATFRMENIEFEKKAIGGYPNLIMKARKHA